VNVVVRLGFLVLIAECGWAQSSAQELADAVAQQWAGGSEAGFAALYPFREGRDDLANAASKRWKRINGLSSVIRGGGQRAVLLLSGVPLAGNAGDDTGLARGFSGVYEASASAGRWRLDRQVPLQDLGQIRAQQLNMTVRPGHGVDVEDRMSVRIAGSNGFAARLNYRANLRRVTAAGGDARYQFGGGLLWADLPPGEAELTLQYSIEVETAPNDANSGRFTEPFGHIRNQYFWHPFFDFANPEDQAGFQVKARIPKAYGLTVSLPQTEHIEGEYRIVVGKTVHPTMALSLAYDRDWNVLREKAAGVRLELFLTPEFRPAPAAVVQEVQTVYPLLANRFGEPGGGYLAIVQLRADPSGDAWHFNSNQAVFATGSPGSFARKEAGPKAGLGHEIGHLWTNGAGPAANFLREGWATYTESLVLEQEFGADTARLFWKSYAQVYLLIADGKASILEDRDNGGLSYAKGSWVFHMLEQALGSDAFAKAMTRFSRRSLAGEATWEVLAECFQELGAPEFDARAFLLPWLQEKSAPHLTAQVDGRRVTVRQEEPFFQLPVTVEAKTAQGTERHRVWIRGREATVEFTGDVTEPRLDPDEVLLLRR
jgi:hypothetical protein